MKQIEVLTGRSRRWENPGAWQAVCDKGQGFQNGSKKGEAGMKRSSLSLILFFLTFLLSSCGLYLQHQMNTEMNELMRDVASRWYVNNVARWEDISRSHRAIYAKYGYTLDVFDELALSYIVALASYLDRGTISEQDFQYLSTRMLANIELEKQKLALQRQAIQAQRDLAWQQFWANYQQNFRSPVICSSLNLGSGFSSIRCY